MCDTCSSVELIDFMRTPDDFEDAVQSIKFLLENANLYWQMEIISQAALRMNKDNG